ncbi:hypothetical protein [Oceanicola sp. 22II-s10i]|uniref:hypothetical protein n=1 Tax=Oceanicola sp. 22II-s10i TaxID=1317116 RepID=UPI000B5246AE|nr:hypothetical protein [Oceanicola sp. 22II-s10i]
MMAFKHTRVALAAGLLAASAGSAVQAQVFTSDVIIQDSLCVGVDCASSENFGADTIRLKENNLRIHFDDTSNSGSFPANDWRLIANDTVNGGDNYFAIQDATSNGIPFRVKAGANTNSLVVDNDGDIGIKTLNPVVDIHVVEGNTPTLRLQQDGSDGFASQTWDVAGNESNFFIRDVTNGSELPFRIEPGADDDAIYIEDTNDIGLGTSNPEAALHVRRSDAARLLLENSTATVGAREMLAMQNAGTVYMSMEDLSIAAGSDTGRIWNVQNQGGTFRVTTEPGGANDIEMQLDPGGNMTLEGALNSIGDGAKLVAENNSGTTAARELMALKNNGVAFFSLEDTSLAAGSGTGRVWNFQNQSGEFRATTEPGGPSDIEMRLTPSGNMYLKGQLFTAGSCTAGCDRVFDADYPLPTIAQQAAMMREKKHLPNVGPTPEDGPFNITAMTGGMLNELEKAHLYIAQLHEQNTDLQARLTRLEAITRDLAAQR